MRIWNINPKLLCKKHLITEHLSLHTIVALLNNGRKLTNYYRNKHVQLSLINPRHEELVVEMTSRGCNHTTPLAEDFSKSFGGSVDADENLRELYQRCVRCRQRIVKQQGKIHLKGERK